MKEENNFRPAFYFSLISHIVVITFLYFGAPLFIEKYKPDPEFYSFEMLPASAIANLPKNAPVIKKKNPKDAEKKVEEPKTITKKEPIVDNSIDKEKKADNKPDLKKEVPQASKPDVLKSEKMIEDDIKEEDDLQEISINPKESEPKEEAKPKEEPKKEKPKKEKKLLDSKKQPSKKASEINKKNLRKNLEKSSSSSSPFDVIDEDEIEEELKKDDLPKKKTSKKDEFQDVILDDSKFSTSEVYDEYSPLSITEKMMIKRQIEKNWSPPVGLDSARDIRILLHLKLNKDGSVKNLDVKNVICPKKNISVCKLVAESAIRATRKASPIENLLPERYDIWGEFDIDFDPSSLL